MSDDPQRLAEEFARLQPADLTPELRARVLDAFASDAGWYYENPHYDGLGERGWTLHLWQELRGTITRLGLVDDLLARVRATGDGKLLYRAMQLGPRALEFASEVIAHGPDELALPAESIVSHHLDKLSADDALGLYLCAFDRAVPDGSTSNDVFVATWSKLAEPEGRAAVAARWADGSLRAWIAARRGCPPVRARHLVALLAAAPAVDPLLYELLAGDQLLQVIHPLLLIDNARATEVIETDARIRAWAEPLAEQFAGPRNPPDPALELGLVAAVPSARVYDRLIATIEQRVVGYAGYADMSPSWRALATHVRRDLTRFDRAATAAIGHQLLAPGPGDPGPPWVMRSIGAIDPPRMLALMLARRTELESSRNAYCFAQLIASYKPAP